MITCPKCKHVFKDPSRKNAGKSRWKGKSKAERSKEMKRVRAQALRKEPGDKIRKGKA